MGCNSSKQEAAVSASKSNNNDNNNHDKNPNGARKMERAGSSSVKPSDRLYKVLFQAQDCKTSEELAPFYERTLTLLEQQNVGMVKYQHSSTKATALHLATQLIDLDCSKQLLTILQQLCQLFPQALCIKDREGNIPLHYAVAPSTNLEDDPTISSKSTASSFRSKRRLPFSWQARGVLVSRLIQADPISSQQYLKRNDVMFHASDATGGCSPLYRVLQTLKDDFSSAAPSVSYIDVIHRGADISEMPGIGNASDGDKPLSLLYRRFTRQFDISEKFFAGDNSRPEVLEHRQKFKTAAGNTWKIIEVLLRPQRQQQQQQDQPWGIVHRAVQVETPPDLLRYIVETNAQDLTRVDADGNLPLHYAATNKPPKHIKNAHFPVFYNKYVVDELLYKFPEGANMQDAQGRYPLTLAVRSNKQWIGGGIKSLYDAFPDAMSQIDLESHESLKRALSLISEKHLSDDDSSDDEDYGKEEKEDSNIKKMGIIKDNHHDAIMLVQQKDVDVSEVVTSMWAHEEDAGVQMLGCVAIYKMLHSCHDNSLESLRIALSAVAAVVNAMKAHPNEMIVQETACKALRCLAPSDGKRELSMVASGAVAAIVGAMQAHVGDVGVQQEACSALAAIVHEGGADRATIVASVSGVTAILNALSAHSKQVSVQKTGLQALVSMTDHAKEANLPELPRSQTEPILINAKQAFPKECGLAVDILWRRMSA
jgi:ankyrin repeat protein